MGWRVCLRHLAFLVLVPVVAGLIGLWIIRAAELGYWLSRYSTECLAAAALALVAWLVVSGTRSGRTERNPGASPR